MKSNKNSIIYLLVIVALALIPFILRCADPYDPIQRTAVQVVFISVVAVIGIFLIAILAGIAKGSRTLAWIILTTVAFAWTPNEYKITVFSLALGMYCLASSIVILLGELETKPPRFVRSILLALIIMGLFLVIPWGILQGLTTQSGLVSIALGPKSGLKISLGQWVGLFGIKVCIPIIGSRLLNNNLENRGRGVLFRVLIRSGVIWIWSLLPFPILGIGFWRETMLTGGLSSLVDGVFDVIHIGVGWHYIGISCVGAILTLLATPGVLSFYASSLHHPLAALIAVGFVILTCRVFFLILAYGYGNDS